MSIFETDNIRIKVPKYHITRFYGDDASKWLTFWNSFETAVHNNESLNNVDKFNYLKAHLGGSALNTVEGFPISAKTYDEAPLKNSNNLRSFRKFIDNCNVQLRSLNPLGVSSANYGKILCPMLLKLIPSDLVLDYNKLQQREFTSCLFSSYWKIEASWDSKLPIDIERKFETWKKQLIGIQDLKVPRRLSNLDLKDTNLSLQVFCDASKLLYTTCVFLRAEREGEVTCQLIQARSKVVPLKGTSIPGLELLACTIGARIADSVKKDLHMENVDVTYWSDSMDALHWIKRDGPWATFVANRVEEITPVFTANLTSS
ncbi:uncharacterized protein TNIN_435861 [Trichonephila inaurata madagascariensis]|uniref:Uncharacterized protein n=1 Tax=Trichonephila inaurata madagascariensis TaxID=2747483 RepID=A0A8X7BUP9_9ARAC|nr:uncharacterized protein TNIN_435861 [Trichonephila inaurata madagascariensis]